MSTESTALVINRNYSDHPYNYSSCRAAPRASAACAAGTGASGAWAARCQTWC